MRQTIGNKGYCFDKSKSTGMYAAWEQKKTGYKKIFECETIEQLKDYIKNLSKLAVQRKMRAEVSNLCGTSYAAAKRDMGL